MSKAYRKELDTFMATTSPVVRVETDELAAAGVARVTGVKEGLPLLANGQVLKVRNVVWCTGFKLDFAWIKLPVFDEGGKPKHEQGVVPDAPGLYFMGLFYQYAMSSSLPTGVGRDAKFIANVIAKRT